MDMQQLEETIKEYGVQFKPRFQHWLTRLLNKLGGSTAWTTIGNVVYYPDEIEDPFLFPEIIAHELVHVVQYKELGKPLFFLLYCLLPLPVFFAYFRWRFEREGYLVEAKLYLAENRTSKEFISDSVARTLWMSYLFPWPQSWMRSWFLKKLGE